MSVNGSMFGYRERMLKSPDSFVFFSLKQHMREAAERRQQLELEHEQALAVLNTKQQEIELLQKVSDKRESKV